MDGICRAVLDKIYALGAPGRYFIISDDEFFENFPDDAKQDTAALKKALKTLTDSGYTDIRYSGNGLHCIALLKLPPVTEEIPTPPNIPQTDEKTIHVPTFKAAFIGGAIGGTVGGAITALLSLLFLLC